MNLTIEEYLAILGVTNLVAVLLRWLAAVILNPAKWHLSSRHETQPHPVRLRRLIATIPTGAGQRATVRFDPRGQTLVFASLTGPIELWDIADPAKPRLRTTITVDHDATGDIALSPDGRTLAVSASDRTIRLWDLADLAHPSIRAVLTGADRPIAFHPDNHTLAVIGTNGLLQLRETDPDQAAARICALTTATMTRAAWNQYLPGEPYQPPCP